MSTPVSAEVVRAALGVAQEWGFLGAVPLDEQIAHAEGFVAVVHALSETAADHHEPSGDATPGCWLDLGSGGGLPGLVLAALWPDTPGVLLDSAHRRTSFLAGVLRDLHWEGRVTVVTARAEEAGRDVALRARFDMVAARSFGAPAVTAECAAPFLAAGGRLVVSEPPPDTSVAGLPERPRRPGEQAGGAGHLAQVPATSHRWPLAPLAELGMRPGAAWRGQFGYQVIDQIDACPDRFPRRSGIPAKRPLYRS